MHFSKSLQGSKSAMIICRFNRADFVVTTSYMELLASIK